MRSRVRLPHLARHTAGLRNHRPVGSHDRPVSTAYRCARCCSIYKEHRAFISKTADKISPSRVLINAKSGLSFWYSLETLLTKPTRHACNAINFPHLTVVHYQFHHSSTLIAHHKLLPPHGLTYTIRNWCLLMAVKNSVRDSF